MSGLLGPVTANPLMMAQALKAKEQPRKQLTGQGLLDTAAIGLSPVPVIGDALGLAADASRYINDPSSRTPLNFGLTALGALPFVPPASAIFGGVLAKTANLDKKAIAEGMEKAGRSRDDIWKETGWFKGPEGKWKFEIDDSGAKLNLNKERYFSTSERMPIKDNEAGQYTESSLNSILNHQNLRKAYPLDANVTMKSYGAGGGAYRSTGDKAFITIDGAIAKQPIAKANDGPFPISQADADRINAETFTLGSHRVLDPQASKSTLLHEIQHGIQDLEGFAKGGSAREMGNAMGGYRTLNEQFNAAFDKYLTSSDEIVKSNALQEMNYLKPKIAEFNKFRGITSPEEAYTKLAGEAEARAVQSRMNMNQQQRQATPPWQSYDVPWEQLIIK